NVLPRPATPTLAAQHQLALDHALGAERDGHLSVESLCGGRHEDPHRAPQRRKHFGPAHDLGEMRRADLLLPLRDEHKVHWGFAAGPRMAWSVAKNAASGPFWFTAPRPTTILPGPGLSTRAAAHGGEVHSAGSACFTSYMKYRPSVRGAPASSVAKMPG